MYHYNSNMLDYSHSMYYSCYYTHIYYNMLMHYTICPSLLLHWHWISPPVFRGRFAPRTARVCSAYVDWGSLNRGFGKTGIILVIVTDIDDNDTSGNDSNSNNSNNHNT